MKQVIRIQIQGSAEQGLVASFRASLRNDSILAELLRAFNGCSNFITSLGVLDNYFAVEISGVSSPIASLDLHQTGLLRHILYEDMPKGKVRVEALKNGFNITTV